MTRFFMKHPLLLRLIPWIFVILGLILFHATSLNISRQTLANQEVNKTNQYYVRVVACLTSVSPIKRTPEYVRYCYDLAEKETGVSEQRFGDGVIR